MTPTSVRNGRSLRKTVLFCQSCEYEAPTDGKWVFRYDEAAEGRRADIECPDCGHRVVSQPIFELVA